jgi:two-component system response regulator YesN
MKIVFVDDEEIVLKGLQAVVEKSGRGWQIAGLCGSGEDALGVIAEKGADVVITDIRMAGMSGLELAEKLKETYGNIIVILLTGFAEFSFAKRAVGLSAFDYLLKPARYTDILECLVRAEKHLEKMRSLNASESQSNRETIAILTEKFIFDCMKGLVVSEGEFSKKCALYGIDIRDFVVVRAAYEQLGNQFDESALDQAMLNFAIRNMAEELFAKLESLHFIMEDLHSFVMLVPLRGESMEAFFYLMFKYIRLSRKLLGIQMRAGASRLVGSFAEVRRGYVEASASMEKSDGSKRLFSSPHEEESLSAFYSKAVQDALAYIHEHYCEEISLKAVAKLVFLNAWYFSDLFKKEVGTAFTNYVMELRIKKAKELLANKRLSVYQISYMVGINAPGYFSQVFKRITGLSPKEYRSGHQNKNP